MRRLLGCAVATLTMIAIPATSAHADPGHGGFGGNPGHGYGHRPNPGRGHHRHHHHHHHHPYTGGAPTHTWTASTPTRTGHEEPISVDVSSLPGFATPTGDVAVRVVGPDGYSWTGTQGVSGRMVTFAAPALPEQGFYAVSAAYSPGNGSPFKPSAATASFFTARAGTAFRETPTL